MQAPQTIKTGGIVTARIDGSHAIGRLKVRSTGRIFSIFSLLNRNVKKERVSAEEMGEGLWKFCKSVSREFHVFFKQVLSDMEVVLDEELEFNTVQEIVILNLWLVTHELTGEKKTLVALHQKYFARQGQAAGKLPTREEQVQYMKDVKHLLVERCDMYNQLWNARRLTDQTILASYFLQFALSRDTVHPAANDKSLIHQVNTYLRVMPRTIQELRERFEIRD